MRHLRPDIIRAARMKDSSISKDSMIVKGTWGYFVGTNTYVARLEVNNAMKNEGSEYEQSKRILKAVLNV